jgi:hypothetical protein
MIAARIDVFGRKPQTGVREQPSDHLQNLDHANRKSPLNLRPKLAQCGRWRGEIPS